MMKKLISHEMPFSLMRNYQSKWCDYLYILLHKYIENDAYRDYILSHDIQTITLLDNSCYELGAALDNKTLHDAVLEIMPTIFVLPDVMGNKEQTIERSLSFLKDSPLKFTSPMAVIQGSSFDEMIDCYKIWRDNSEVDIIGIPFCFKWANWNYIDQSNERIKLLQYLVEHNIVDVNRRHHLFGTWRPVEFSYYKDYNWIYSIDTSNPIMLALEGKTMTSLGIHNKPTLKFDEAFDKVPSDFDIERIEKNVKTFRNIVNGI